MTDVTDETFIKIWNDSETAEEAARRSNMKDGQSASTRAWRLRAAKLHLKNMQFTKTNLEKYKQAGEKSHAK